MNSLGILCSDISALLTLYAHSSAVIVSSVGTNFAPFVCRHTITRTVSYNLLDPGSNDFGSFTIKSIVTLLYSLVGGGKSCNRL
jgi:hypothetical protein